MHVFDKKPIVKQQNGNHKVDFPYSLQQFAAHFVGKHILKRQNANHKVDFLFISTHYMIQGPTQPYFHSPPRSSPHNSRSATFHRSTRSLLMRAHRHFILTFLFHAAVLGAMRTQPSRYLPTLQAAPPSTHPPHVSSPHRRPHRHVFYVCVYLYMYIHCTPLILCIQILAYLTPELLLNR